MEANERKEVDTKVDYEKYVVRRALSEYWRAEDKVEIVLYGNGWENTRDHVVHTSGEISSSHRVKKG